MRVRRLAERADALSRDAWMERQRFATRARRSLGILGDRVGSPAGLAVAFSLGFIAGTPAARRGRRRGRSAGERGDGALTGLASRVVAALVARYLLSATAGAAPASEP